MYISPIRAGDSKEIEIESVTDTDGTVYSAANGWAVMLVIKGNSNALEKAADANWLVSLTAAETAALTAGFCAYGIIATKDSQKKTIDYGQIEILPNLDTAIGTFEYRSQAKQDLQAVQSAIRAIIANQAVQEYSINGRSLRKYTLTELRERETELKFIVKREEQAEAVNKGQPDPRKLYIKF